jgi:hypothetical protein
MTGEGDEHTNVPVLVMALAVPLTLREFALPRLSWAEGSAYQQSDLADVLSTVLRSSYR